MGESTSEHDEVALPPFHLTALKNFKLFTSSLFRPLTPHNRQTNSKKLLTRVVLFWTSSVYHILIRPEGRIQTKNAGNILISWQITIKTTIIIKGVHLCAGGTSSAFSGIFFRESYINFLNELYVILTVHFSILLNNFFLRLIWNPIFTQGKILKATSTNFEIFKESKLF